VRKERTFAAPGAGVLTLTLPETGQRIRLIGIVLSLVTDVNVADRSLVIVRTINGAGIDETHASPTFPAQMNVNMVCKPGLHPQAIESPTGTMFVSWNLPEFGIVQDKGDELTLVLFGGQAGDAIGAGVMEYLAEKEQ